MVEFSPATREARVRFPASASLHFFFLLLLLLLLLLGMLVQKFIYKFILFSYLTLTKKIKLYHNATVQPQVTQPEYASHLIERSSD